MPKIGFILGKITFSSALKKGITKSMICIIFFATDYYFRLLKKGCYHKL